MVVRLFHRICSCLGKNLQAWFSDHTKSSKTLTAWNLSSLWWLFQAYSLALLTLLPNTLIHHLSSMFNFLFWFNKFFLLFFLYQSMVAFVLVIFSKVSYFFFDWVETIWEYIWLLIGFFFSSAAKGLVNWFW